MKVLINFYLKASNKRDTIYKDGKPVTDMMYVDLPLQFGYGSYNKPKSIMNTGIYVEDIISIEPTPENNPDLELIDDDAVVEDWDEEDELIATAIARVEETETAANTYYLAP